MEYFISAFWTLLELVVFHYFWNAFLVTKTTKKTYLLSLAGAWILPTIYTLTGLNADYGRIISFTFVVLVCIFNFRGPILQNYRQNDLYFARLDHLLHPASKKNRETGAQMALSDTIISCNFIYYYSYYLL